MFKILICIGLSVLYASQKTENAASASVSHQKGNIILGKSPTITTNPDYAKVKGGQNLTTDADIDEVAAQKVANNYQIKDFQNWLKIDRKINLGLLLSRLTIILIIFALIWKAINRFTVRFVGSVIKRTHKHQEYTDVQSLANTAGPILNSILRWVLICIAFLIVLTEIGFDIMPIISIFGVLGLAISIGAQTLVKDIISGVLTLFEGIVSVGEIVELNGNIGTIEGMSLRAIEFRHTNGTIQVVSFSEINSLINLSRDYSICSIVVPVSHEADIQKVEDTYIDVFNNLKANDEWKNEIISDIEVTGVLSITETAVYIRASMRVKPDPYDLFGQEFRKQLFMQMKERKIPAPKFANVMLENER
jgi:small-conductance mechanosensitive channel